MDIHATAMVDPSAEIAEGVKIGAYSFIGPNVKIGAGSVIEHHVNIYRDTTVGADCRFWPFCSLGTDPQDLKYDNETTRLEIGDKVQIREFVTVNRGTGHGGGTTRVGDGCLLMSYSHVAHDCQLGCNVIMANSATLAGHVTVEDYVGIGGLVAIHQFVRLGTHCFVGGMSGVAQDLAPYTLCEGNRAKSRAINIIGLRRAGFSEESLNSLKSAFKIIFRTRTPLKQAIAQVREEVASTPEVQRLLDFFESSERGVSR